MTSKNNSLFKMGVNNHSLYVWSVVPMAIKLSRQSGREFPWGRKQRESNCSLPLLSQTKPRRLSEKGSGTQLLSKYCISGCANASARLSAGRSQTGRLAVLEMRYKSTTEVLGKKWISFSRKRPHSLFPVL